MRGCVDEGSQALILAIVMHNMPVNHELSTAEGRSESPAAYGEFHFALLELSSRWIPPPEIFGTSLVFLGILDVLRVGCIGCIGCKGSLR